MAIMYGYKIVFLIVALYVAVLLLINAVPNVKVRSLGWWSICGVTITLPATTISIEKISIKLNFSWRNSTPFRMVSVHLNSVEVWREDGSCSSASAKPDFEVSQVLDDVISLRMPKVAYNIIFKRRWLNELSIQIRHLSIYHHAVDKDMSLHLDFVKIQNTSNEAEATDNLCFSVIDGYLKDTSKSCGFESLRLFHNLELDVSSDLIFSCPAVCSDRIQLNLSNFGIRLTISELLIRRLATLLSKRKTRMPDRSSQTSLPSLRQVFEMLHKISFISVKIDNSEVHFKEMRILTSSYSINLARNESYKQQTVATLSSYVTGAKVYHLGSKCMDIPSLTHILDLDMTDFYQASRSSDKNNFNVDLKTTLSLTNSSLSVFYDQISYLLNFQSERKRKEREYPNSNYGIANSYLKHLKKCSTKIVIVDFNHDLHMPRDEHAAKHFQRDSVNNIIVKSGSQAVVYKFSSKNLGGILAQRARSKTPLRLKSFIKMKNFAIEVEDNRIVLSDLSALVGYNLDSQKIGLRISCKRFQLKSVNTMIFHVIRVIREARIVSANEACAKMHLDSHDNGDASKIPVSMARPLFDIFELFPSIISHVRFKANLMLAYIICNDCLPSHVIFDKQLGENVDLADFKRGVSCAVYGMDFTFKNQEEIFDAHLKQLEINTLSDYSSEYTVDFDQKNDPLGEVDVSETSSVESEMSGFSIPQMHDEVKTVKRVLSIGDIMLKSTRGNRKRLVLSIPDVEGRLDMYLVWCIMYAFTLVEMSAPTVERTYSKREAIQLKSSSKVVCLDLEIESLSLIIRLPNDVDILLEIDSFNLKDSFVSPHCRINYTRLFVVHPATKLWSRLVSISNSIIDSDTVSRSSINLRTEVVRFNIPFQYLVYTVIDNVITFVKAIRQIHTNFLYLSKNIDDYSRLHPEARDPIKLPRVQWKSNKLGITLENDEFETELSLIYQFGKIESVERERKLALFEKAAKELRSKAQDALSKSKVDDKQFVKGKANSWKQKTNLVSKFAASDSNGNSEARNPNCKAKTSLRETLHNGNKSEISSTNARKVHRTFSKNSDLSKGRLATKKTSKTSLKDEDLSEEKTTEEEEPILTEERAEELISEAYDKLLLDFSSAWVFKFRLFRHSFLKNWNRRMTNIWGPDIINKVMKSKYDIQDYARGPPQFQAVFFDFDLTVQDPKLDDIHKFLHDYGKGQPDFQYSILIPAYLRLKSSNVYMSMRDYVLPLLSFPRRRDENLPVMDLKGTIVINEKLVSIPEELREIFVPFSQATASQKVVDNFYSMCVLRTLTPVKTMFDLSFDLDTDRACVLSWCKSYSPGISSMAMAFENFTKPEIDDSPLGWWDKLALIAHGKMQFNIKNELCLHIKSSLSPYSLIGNSSGLVFCWKDNVSLRINDTGKHSELVILESDDFILGIPNYSDAEEKAWSLTPRNWNTDINENDFETDKFQKRIMKLTSDERVIWKLGLLFERNTDKNAKQLGTDMERTNIFKPHYDVTVTGPQYKFHPDSFEGFRSDYLHLAISVNSSSKKGNSHNHAFFTPLTIEYFKVWWKTLKDTISLPIREGKLFAKSPFKASSVKFSPHLFTLKYQLVLDPLTVSKTYLSSGNKELNHNVVAYGVKGKSSKCTIDLHQRREIARYVNENLGIDKKVRKLKMHSGEIEISDADIRLIEARFNDISMYGKLLSYYSGESDSDINLDEYETHLRQQNLREKSNINFQGGVEDFSWIDFEDFVEMEEHDILSPNMSVKVIPFFQTPSFTYFRQLSLEKDEGKYPFGHEPSHDCLIGANTPEVVQAQIYERRVKEVKKRLEDSKQSYKSLSRKADSDSSHDVKAQKMEKEILGWKEKIESLQRMRENLMSGANSPSYNNLSRSQTRESANSGISSHLKPQLSRNLSVYSTIDSLEQAREVTSPNSLLSSYHNRFLIHNLKMRWSNEVRDVFTSFLSLVGHKKSEQLALTKRALDLMEKMLNTAEKFNQSPQPNSTIFEDRFTCGDDVIGAFEEYLMSLENDAAEIEPQYLVKIIKPQVHFMCNSNPDAAVILVSKDIEHRVLGVHQKGTDNIISETGEDIALLEMRHGVLFRDSHVLAFQKKDFQKTATNPYGIGEKSDAWPPWINLEDCSDLVRFEKNLVVERTTMAMSFKKPNLLAVDTSKKQEKRSELVVQLAKLVINATSDQYSAFYFILTDLLIHKNQPNYLRQRVEQISSVLDKSDFAELGGKVQNLQNNIRISRLMLLRIGTKDFQQSQHKQRQQNHIKLELTRMKIELSIIMRSLESVGSNKKGSKAMSSNWVINVDQLIVHFLDNSRNSLIDMALASAKFTRSEEANGSNSNSVQISLIQGFNLRDKAPYPELIRPFMGHEHKEVIDREDPTKPVIQMTWKMLNPVGGIRVMSEAELMLQPLYIQLDYDTATTLFDYLFPKSVDKPKKTDKSPKDDNTVSGDSESETGYDSTGSRNSTSSPTHTFRKLFNRDKSSKSDSNSVFTRHSSSKESYSAESVSMDSSESLHRDKDQVMKMSKKKLAKKKEETSDEISLIMNRSAQYFVVGDFQINRAKFCVSFKAPKHLNIIDVHNLEFTLPILHYRDKTWTSDDFILQLKKDIIKIFLANSGKIIGNKFKIRNRIKTSTPLKQVSNFSSYMTLDELQEEGRPRDHIKITFEDSSRQRRQSRPFNSTLPDRRERDQVDYNEVFGHNNTIIDEEAESA